MGNVGGRDVIVLGGHDGEVRIWDATSRLPVGEPLLGHDGEVSAVAVGQVSGRDVVLSGGHDGTVRTWDAASGNCESTLDLLGAISDCAFGGPRRVCFAWLWDEPFARLL